MSLSCLADMKHNNETGQFYNFHIRGDIRTSILLQVEMRGLCWIWTINLSGDHLWHTGQLLVTDATVGHQQLILPSLGCGCMGPREGIWVEDALWSQRPNIKCLVWNDRLDLYAVNNEKLLKYFNREWMWWNLYVTSNREQSKCRHKKMKLKVVRPVGRL